MSEPGWRIRHFQKGTSRRSLGHRSGISGRFDSAPSPSFWARLAGRTAGRRFPRLPPPAPQCRRDESGRGGRADLLGCHVVLTKLFVVGFAPVLLQDGLAHLLQAAAGSGWPLPVDGACQRGCSLLRTIHWCSSCEAAGLAGVCVGAGAPHLLRASLEEPQHFAWSVSQKKLLHFHLLWLCCAPSLCCLQSQLPGLQTTLVAVGVEIVKGARLRKMPATTAASMVRARTARAEESARQNLHVVSTGLGQKSSLCCLQTLPTKLRTGQTLASWQAGSRPLFEKQGRPYRPTSAGSRQLPLPPF
mmetsp:Transcript_19785/g.42936  ORF Transcript_19785/g.42936 Transcript_19785/m.42936 type:complete len:302 (-) Transcript_19785:60-965(-)